ncbi:hypothetical protein EC957_001421 [Mortierella hygrophila]|uniref:AIG1-type G domain-containing protein n=1 Tax=Mortierella hygrophila TaxID=979708 RepID=A0A9P6F657_9FUNG|nr:hypothetical protein EC957_001421 [Mortierella hygrophila]
MYQRHSQTQTQEQNLHRNATTTGAPEAPRGYQHRQQQQFMEQPAIASAPLPLPQEQRRHSYQQQQTPTSTPTPQKAEHYPPQKAEHNPSQTTQQYYPAQPYQHQQQQHQVQQQQEQQQEQEPGSPPVAREFTIVALGKSGEGKSTLLNSILGREIFLAKASVSEVTQHVDKATNHFLNIPSNPVMHCIDTPSFNGKLHDPHRVNELGALLTKVAAGVDAFLFTVKCTRYRFDSTFYQTLLTYQSLLTPAFWSKLILVFTHATPELLPSTNPESRLPLMAWAREIQEKFKLPAAPKVIFAMDFARFPYPSGGAQDFWEKLMELDANTEPYCHRPFLESFGNGIAVEGYVQRIKGHLAVFEPRFFESQAEGQYQEHKQALLKKRGTEGSRVGGDGGGGISSGWRFGLFRKSTQATTRPGMI